MKKIFLFLILHLGFLTWSVAQDENAKENVFSKTKEFQLAAPIVKSKSVFFQSELSVQLELKLDGAQIHYTLDGSTPSAQSPICSQPILLKKSTTILAKAFHQDYLPSEIVQADFFKIKKNIKVKNVTLNRIPNEKYQGTGAAGLVDKIKGTTNFRTSAWMGFGGDDLEILIEFEKKTKFRKVISSTLVDHNSWIFSPQSIEVYCSKNGKEFKLLGKSNFSPPQKNTSSGFQFLNTSFKKEKSKFVKVVLRNIPAIPEWHVGKGKPAWMFVDEVIIE